MTGDLAGDDIGAWFTFDTEENEQIEVAVGVSFVSMENARQNLEAEQHGAGFDEIYASARKQWNDDLSRIIAEGGTKEQKNGVLYCLVSHADSPEYPPGCKWGIPSHGNRRNEDD